MRQCAIAIVFSGLVATAVAAPGGRPSKPQESTTADARLAPRALLDKYCVTCHNDRLRTANLVLSGDKIDVARVSDQAEIWEKVIRKVGSGAMPPARAARPPAPTLRSFRD